MADVGDIVDMNMVNFMFSVLPDSEYEWLLTKIGDTTVTRKLLDTDEGKKFIIRESLVKEYESIDDRKSVCQAFKIVVEVNTSDIIDKLNKVSAIGSDCYKCEYFKISGHDYAQYPYCKDNDFGGHRDLTWDFVNKNVDKCTKFEPMSQDKCVFCDGTELWKRCILPDNVVYTGYVCLKCNRYFYFINDELKEWKLK